MSHIRRRREVLRLIRSLRKRGKGLLNAAVLKAKIEEAHVIDKGGAGRQVRYLVEKIGLGRLQKLVKSLFTDPLSLKRLTRTAYEKVRLADIMQALYAEKQKEADDLLTDDVEDQLRYLQSRWGIDALAEFVEGK